MALRAGNIERALEHFTTASEGIAGSGRRREEAAIAAALGETLHRLDRNEEAARAAAVALAALAGGPPIPEEAALHAILGRALVYGGEDDAAAEPLARALELARRDGLAAVESRVSEQSGDDRRTPRRPGGCSRDAGAGDRDRRT